MVQAASKSEAVRLIRQHAVRVNDKVVESPMEEFEVRLGEHLTIAVGPKRFVTTTGTRGSTSS